MTDNELVAKAKEALEYSYSPYSHFAVGAALLSTDGQVFTGCNIENSSFGATNCAERTAVFKAVSEGVKDFKAIAIVCSGDQPAYPCGICRQVFKCLFWPQSLLLFALTIIKCPANGQKPCAFSRKSFWLRFPPNWLSCPNLPMCFIKYR